MTATTTYTAPTARPTTSTKVWRTGAAAGAVASLATVAVAAIASAADVPLTVGGEEIPLVGFAQLTFVLSMVGAALAVVFSHRARRPRHTFVITTIALTALSFVPDLTADATTATRLVLAVTHLVAAAIVIPALSSRLSD